MITIVSCTNRDDSNSKMVSDYYQQLFRYNNTESRIVDLNDLPGDFISTALYKNAGQNKTFNRFRDQVQEANKLLFVIAEYNGSFPGVLKAFIDGLKFPGGLENKKAALTGVSAGPMGGALALSHFTDILNYLGTHVLARKVRLPSVYQNFDGKTIHDKELQELIELQVKELISF